jgi:Carboxypeptidase regulatory-like domain
MTTSWKGMTTRKRKKRISESFFVGLQVEPTPVSGGLQSPWPAQQDGGQWRPSVEPASRLEAFRHPFLPASHLMSMWRTTLPLALVILLGAASAPAAPAAAQSSSNSHARDFLIFATVFNSQGFALPGARVRVRRADEKKFRWEAVSDHQGELGIRVQQDAEYELTVEAHGFQPQTRKVDARDGNREDLTLRLEPLAKEGKP